MACKPGGTHHNACACREEAFRAVQDKAFAALKAFGDFKIETAYKESEIGELSDALIFLERALRKV